MTNTLRQQIRAAIDARARELRQRFIDAGELAVCSNCGADQDMRTPGCKTCGDRHRKWRMREDPTYLERMRAYDHARRDRKVQRERERRRRLREAAMKPSALAGTMEA